MTTEEWNDKQTGSNDGRADLSSPLGAVAMWEAMVKALDERGQREQVDFGLGRETQNFYRAREIVKALPLPTHAALLAAAMRLPEVAAMQAALDAAEADKARAVEAERERCAALIDCGGCVDLPCCSPADCNAMIAAALRTGAKP